MANVDETLCKERHSNLENTCTEIRTQVKDLHSTLFKNGFIARIERIDAISKTNTTILIIVLGSILGLSVYAFKEISDFKKDYKPPWANVCEANQ